ncbi:MAG: flavin reductase family protein [Clostridia bacterium]|nr:flavin reductase family protein [Clostridia bacterium]
MRKNFGVKPLAYPLPVFIVGTYDENGVADAMNAAWGGISEENEISLCIDTAHRTYTNVIARKAFTVSMGVASQVAACDYVGIVSGNDVPDKVARAGLTAVKSEFVDAPVFLELPMAVECRLKSFDEEACRMVGEIVNVSADESVLGEDGKIDVRKLDPITFDAVSHAYLRLGEAVGKAFSAGLALRDQA